MSIQAISVPKNSNNKSNIPINNEFKGNFANTKSELSTPKKLGIFATTLIGVSIVMAKTLKGKGYSLKLKDIIKTLKTKPSKLGLLDVKYDSKKDEIEKLVSWLALGSVGGGLVGGAIFDKKENLKAKFRESIIQLVGNIFTPLACVAGGMRLFNKHENKIIDTLKIFKGKTKGVPGLIASGLCLLSGILLGNKVGNLINQQAFNSKEERKIKLSDMSPHIDDICVATSLVATGGGIGAYISRIIPAALMVAGVSTGLAQECPAELNKNKASQSKA